MSLEAFYFISQIVGALLLFASVVFVGIQIKQNTKALRAASAFDGYRMWGEYNLNASLGTEEALFRTKLLDPSNQIEDFSDEEKAKARLIAFGFAQFWLSQFRLYQEGSLLREDWEPHGKWAAHFYRLPIMQLFNDEAVAAGTVIPEFAAEIARLDDLIDREIVFHYNTQSISAPAPANSESAE